ncbi:MAG: hypothetical protein ACXVLT_14735 [Flavisolibacter sp.]
MGHFIITLPNNLHGEVRWGTIRKKSLFLDLFKSKKLKNDIKRGYIVNIESTSNEHKEYRLLKTREGTWSSESEGGFQVTPDDEISISIKNEIDSYESRQ